MDVMLGRGSRTSKIKALLKLAISRIAILKRQAQVRSSHARSDVIELLNQGHLDDARLRTVHVIKEQNMLDAYSITETYCHILVQKTSLLKNSKQFPGELREAIASLVYAASRFGEFPELQELRRTFAKKYGQDFTTRAVEFPDNSGVNPKIIEKLSMRNPSLYIRLMALEEIASEIGVSLGPINLNYAIKKTREVGHSYEQPEQKEEPDITEANKVQRLRSPVRDKYYRDAADAAQDAFEFSADAVADTVAAARAALYLSRLKSDGPDHHDLNRTVYCENVAYR